MNIRYAKSYVEVLEIISFFSDEDYSKIPKEKIEFYEKNKDKDYVFKYDPEKSMKSQNVSKEAKAILLNLFNQYFATEKQKEKLMRMLIENEQKLEEEKRKKYNFSDIFYNKK